MWISLFQPTFVKNKTHLAGIHIQESLGTFSSNYATDDKNCTTTLQQPLNNNTTLQQLHNSDVAAASH